MTEGTIDGTQTGDGTGQSNDVPAWIAQLPADLRTNATFTGFKTIGDLAKNHLEVTGKVSEIDGLKEQLGNSIPKLGPDATDEQKAQFYSAIGRPDKPDGYEVKGENLDGDFVKWAKESFFKHGTPKSVAEGMIQEYIAYQEKIVGDYETKRKTETEAAVTKLKQELGDQYVPSVEMVRRVLTKHGGEELFKYLDESGLGNDPRFIRAMINLSKLTGEDTSPQGSQKKDDTKSSGWTYPNTPEYPKLG
jgi:hypothetical protein